MKDVSGWGSGGKGRGNMVDRKGVCQRPHQTHEAPDILTKVTRLVTCHRPGMLVDLHQGHMLHVVHYDLGLCEATMNGSKPNRSSAKTKGSRCAALHRLGDPVLEDWPPQSPTIPSVRMSCKESAVNWGMKTLSSAPISYVYPFLDFK